MPTRPKRRTKRRTKRKEKFIPTLLPIDEIHQYQETKRSPSKRTLKRSPSKSKRILLTKKQRSNSIKNLAITKAQEDEQLGCFGRFCKNIKSKFTRRTRRTRRAGTRKRTRKRKKRR